MDGQSNNVKVATELTVAWLANPHTRATVEEVAAFFDAMQKAVSGFDQVKLDIPDPEPHFEPAVSVRKSLASPDHIVSMIDGKSYKTLKRHLAKHGLTPQEYRERYNLKEDYPMVSPGYSEMRRVFAKTSGLGQKPKQ